MKVLTQYKSDSLNNHLVARVADDGLPRPLRGRGARADAHRHDWYKGSADAIYQNLNIITDEEPDHIFVFGADHVYRMDLRQMLDFHVRRRRPTCTVAAIPVPDRARAREFGIIDVGAERADARASWRSRRTRRPCRATRRCASPRWATTSSPPTRWCRRSCRDAANETSAHDFGKSHHQRDVQDEPASTCTTSPRTRCPGPGEQGARLLAGRGEHRRLLPVQHGPGGGGPDLQPLQRPLAHLHAATTTSRRRSSSSRTGEQARGPRHATRW